MSGWISTALAHVCPVVSRHRDVRLRIRRVPLCERREVLLEHAMISRCSRRYGEVVQVCRGRFGRTLSALEYGRTVRRRGRRARGELLVKAGHLASRRRFLECEI